MTQDAIHNWIEKAKPAEAAASGDEPIVVIKNADLRNKGKLIMDIAEKIRPFLMKMFEGKRDENGMLVQPSRIRGVALNVAQGIVKDHEQKAGA